MNATMTQRKSNVQESNIDNATIPQQAEEIKTAPTKLYRVEEIAEAANISLSYVYALIAKNKPRVYAKDGKSNLFGQEFLETIKTMQPRRYRQKVQVISSKKAQPVQQPHPVVEVKAESYAQTLLQRIDNLEKKVVELSSFLGV